MIVIEHIESGQKFLMVGAGYGLAKSARPSLWGGVLTPTESREQHTLTCVADAEGTLGWIPTDQVRVVTIDGVSVKSVDGLATFEKNEEAAIRLKESELAKDGTYEDSMECARCGKSITTFVCPYCESDSDSKD